ncbi:MAG TPA: hypothetical protein VGM16_08560 [Gammaproteobacteria bacterium]|jgi:hypothetical protein
MQASGKAESLSLPSLENASVLDVATFWLGDVHVRIHLNEQLAELLRYIVEDVRDGYKPGGSHEFNFCPICRERLEEYEQPDIWIRGLKCQNDHEFGERGVRLRGRVDGADIDVCAEFEECTVRQLIEAWVKSDDQSARWLRPQLHESVMRVFKAYAADAAL